MIKYTWCNLKNKIKQNVLYFSYASVYYDNSFAQYLALF